MPLAKEKKRILASLVITLSIIILFFTLYQIQALRLIYEMLELKTLDLRFILKPQPPRSEEIIHIDIDDEAIYKIGWPCPRRYYAYVIDILTECGSKGIIFDILFLDPSQLTVDRKMVSQDLKGEIKERLDEVENDTDKISEEALRGASQGDISTYLSQLKQGVKERRFYLLKKLDQTILDQDELMAQAIKRGNNIFLPFVFPEEKPPPGDDTSFIERFSLSLSKENLKTKEGLYKAKFLSPPIDTFSAHITGTGFVNAEEDKVDGVMRRIPLLWEYKGKIFPQLALASFLTLDKGPDSKIEIVPGRYIKIDEITIPVDEKLQMIIHWAGAWKDDFPHIPFDGIVELKEQREKAEENLIALDQEYTSERLKGLLKELELTPAPSKELLREIDQAKQDIFELLERNIAKIPVDVPKRDELKKHYESIDIPRKKEKELKDKITKLVKGKICFIGLAGTGTHDKKPTPLQPDYPMCGLHSNVLNTILTQNFIKRPSPLVNVVIFLLAGMVIAAITPRFSPWKGMTTSFLLLGIFIGLSQYLFQKNGIAINMVGPISLIISSYTVITSYRYITEEKEKKWIRNAFSHYLSPKVMDEILADPSKLALGGVRKELTVLFSDIRGFTTYCEKRAPEEIIPILNEYLNVMSNVILKYNGTLDKYVGDEIVAFFGAPATKEKINHAEMAVRTAMDMVSELMKLREKWKTEGKEPLDFGVGLNTGPMVVGNMGSAKRMDYTVIGDEVNLGARVEALTRDYNVRIIITQSTYEKVKDLVEVKPLGETTVKGKAKPVQIYELVSLRG